MKDCECGENISSVFPCAFRLTWQLPALLYAALMAATVAVAVPESSPVPQYGYEIVQAYPHDSRAFTQGFEYKDGFLYEGTGLNGRSTLRKERLETGKIIQEIDIPAQYFGEGITVFNREILQVTWQSHVGFVYEQTNFRLLKNFSYQGEGWGLANNGREIYLSDGTSEIRCLDPTTFAEARRFTVHEATHPITELNELEWVNGELFANVWQTDRVVRISPADGTVLGWSTFHTCLPRLRQRRTWTF